MQDFAHERVMMRVVACGAQMDADHNGSIDKAELRSAFAAAGVELTMKEVKAMMAEADEDGDGFLDAQEFENLLINEVKRYKSRSKSVFCSLM